MSMNSISDKLTRTEIRRRMRKMESSKSMIRQLLRTVEALRQENAALRRQSGH